MKKISTISLQHSVRNLYCKIINLQGKVIYFSYSWAKWRTRRGLYCHVVAEIGFTKTPRFFFSISTFLHTTTVCIFFRAYAKTLNPAWKYIFEPIFISDSFWRNIKFMTSRKTSRMDYPSRKTAFIKRAAFVVLEPLPMTLGSETDSHGMITVQIISTFLAIPTYQILRSEMQNKPQA